MPDGSQCWAPLVDSGVNQDCWEFSSNYPRSGLVKIMLSFTLLLLKSDLTFIPHRFGILDFRIRI
jgi:hypothetical protein